MEPDARQSRPNPDGWEGGSEDYGFIRTFDGHIGVNPFEDGADTLHRRNARKGLSDSDIGGRYGDCNY